MKDVRELQDRLDRLRETIEDAEESAHQLARDRVIDPVTLVPRPRTRLADLFRDF